MEEAIFSSGLLRKFSREGKLLAFADDMLLIADNENEVIKVNRCIELWKLEFGLQLNIKKSVWMSNAHSVKEKTSIGLLMRVATFKYLGISCSLSVEQMRTDTKNNIFKYVNIMKNKLKSIKSMKIKEQILSSHFRSLVNYHCPPLRFANIITMEFVKNLEMQGF